MQNDIRQPILEWQAPSRVSHDRGRGWYVGASVVTLGLIVYGILSSSWLFAITIAILAGLFFLVRNEAHPIHTVRILQLGFEFDGKLRPWNELKEFWMLSGPKHCELHVELKKGYMPNLVVHTATMDPLLVRDVLLQFLPQNPHKRERLLDTIIRICKL